MEGMRLFKQWLESYDISESVRRLSEKTRKTKKTKKTKLHRKIGKGHKKLKAADVVEGQDDGEIEAEDEERSDSGIDEGVGCSDSDEGDVVETEAVDPYPGNCV